MGGGLLRARTDDVEPFDRQTAWPRAWAETTHWCGKLRGILTLGAGSAVATAWATLIVTRHGHPSDPALHISSTQFPTAVQVIVPMLAFITGGFLTFLGLAAVRFTVTPKRQRDEAREAVDASERRRKQEQDEAAAKLAGRRVSDAHRAGLQDALEALRESVRAKNELNYGGTNSSRDLATFRTHFPECKKLAANYEMFRRSADLRLEALHQRLIRELAERKIIGTPYSGHLGSFLWENIAGLALTDRGIRGDYEFRVRFPPTL